MKQSMVCSPNFVSISMVKNIKINLEKLKRKEKKKGKELSNQFNKQLESNNHSNMSLPGHLRLRSSCNKNLCINVNVQDTFLEKPSSGTHNQRMGKPTD